MGDNGKKLLGVLKGNKKSLVVKSLLIVGAGIAAAIGINAMKDDEYYEEGYSVEEEPAVIEVDFAVDETEEIVELSNEETEEEVEEAEEAEEE